MSDVIGEGVIVVTIDLSKTDDAWASIPVAAAKSAAAVDKETIKITKAAEREATKQVKAAEKARAAETKAAEKAAAAVIKEQVRVTRAAEKELEKQRKAAEKAHREAGQAAKAAAAALQSNLGKVSGSLGALSAMAGGVTGQLGGALNSVLKPIAEVGAALGPAGLAGVVGVALVAAIGAGTLALVKLGEAAGAAGERLRGTGTITQQQAAFAHELKLATDTSTVATDALTVKLAAQLPITKELSIAWIGLKVALGEVADGSEENGKKVERTWASYLLGKKTYEVLTASGQDLIDSQEKIRIAAENTADALRLAEAEDERRRGSAKAGVTQIAAQPAKDAAAASKAAAAASAAATKAAKEEKAAWDVVLDRYDAVQRALKAHADQMEDQDASKQYSKELQRIAREAEAAGIAIKGIFSDADADLQKERLAAVRAAAIETAEAVAGATVDIFDMVTERQAEAASKIKDHNQELRDSQKSISKQILSLQKQASKATDDASKKNIQNQIDELQGHKDLVDGKIKNNAREAEIHRKAAMRAFVAAKAAGLAEAAIQTAVAVMAQMKLPWPANLIAAAGVAATGAAQIALIASKKAPEFPMGMQSPDHQKVIAIQETERVVTSRGAKDDEKYRKWNEGREGSTDLKAQFIVNRRVIAEAMNGPGGSKPKVDPRSGKSERRR